MSREIVFAGHSQSHFIDAQLSPDLCYHTYTN